MNKLSNTKRLVCCVFQNMADEAIEILESGDFDKNIFDDVGLFANPFPLYLISLCNLTYADDNEWRKDFLDEVIIPMRRQCHQLIDYFRQKGYPVDNPVDFTPYPDERRHFSRSWNMESLLDGTEEELVKKGYDLNECRLCYAVLIGDLDTINRQIAMGTNPDVWISGEQNPEDANEIDDESHNALNACMEYTWSPFDCYGLSGYWRDGVQKIYNDIDYRVLSLLVQGAFYNQIKLRLLPLIR